MSAPTLMVGATLPGSDRDVWTGEVGSLQWASRQALGAHQRALGALIAVIGSREITAGVEPAHRNGKVATLTVTLDPFEMALIQYKHLTPIDKRQLLD